MRAVTYAALLVAGCSTDPGIAPDAGSSLDARPALDASQGDAATADAARDDAHGPDAGAPRSARDWIVEHFEGAPIVSGTLTSRTRVETPALVQGADACCAKYAFDVREEAAPDLREVGLVDVTIHDLASTDAFGGGLQSSGAPGLTLFLANVVIEPRWPEWVSYAETNYDGMVLDDAAAIYAEDLTIRDWNADGAIDDKAPISQFVRLTIEGRGNRGIRFWGNGPHYLVDSRLENDGGLGEGSLLWFADCDAVEVRVYRSTFAGSDTVPPAMISCDAGADPTIVYLDVDPRTTGEMHEMFVPD